MPLEEIIPRYWPIALAIGLIVVWAIRVEAAVKKAATDIEALKQQRVEDLAATRISREETHETLREMRHDIKQLLQAVRTVK